MILEVPEYVAVAKTDEIPEGEMRAFEVCGQRVLVARVDGVFYALGAVCSHGKAYLDEGELEGHRVTCPLHFGVFDVRTGLPVSPPPTQPVPRYGVRVEGGVLLVSTRPLGGTKLHAKPA
jgi:nitrite reductase/ring-hydroxylating ferredoxin subunit